MKTNHKSQKSAKTQSIEILGDVAYVRILSYKVVLLSLPTQFVFFFFNDTATTEIYTLSYTTLFRSHGIAGRKMACRGKGFGCVRCNDCRAVLGLRNCQMKVTPVNAKVVAGAVENVLVTRADGENVERGGLIAEGDDLLARLVDRDVRIYIEQHRD